MRHMYFLVPRTGLKIGGLIAQLKILDVAQSICPAHPVTYQLCEDHTLFLDDVLAHDNANNSIFVIHWGTDVPNLLRRLVGRNVVYHAYSTGYGFEVPPDVPIVAGSRHTQAYWGKRSPNSPIYYLPNVISGEFRNLQKERDIDVLVQKRKSSRYLLEELVSELRLHCSVVVLDSWVDDLAEVFNRSKVYLYDSSEHWARRGVSEGFGLPPLEAMACGCTVFSSVNDGLSDYLEPGFNCQKLRVYAKLYDVDRILKAVKKWGEVRQGGDPIAQYRRPEIERRYKVIISELNDFFDYKSRYPGDIEDVSNRIRSENTRKRIGQLLPHSVRRIKQVLSNTMQPG